MKSRRGAGFALFLIACSRSLCSRCLDAADRPTKDRSKRTGSISRRAIASSQPLSRSQQAQG
jgi:hypothetical protein